MICEHDGEHFHGERVCGNARANAACIAFTNDGHKGCTQGRKKVAKAREMKVALREEEQRALLSGRLLPHEHMPTFTLVERVIASHRAACGKSLFKLNDAGRHAAKQLWEAPIACLVVGG